MRPGGRRGELAYHSALVALPRASGQPGPAARTGPTGFSGEAHLPHAWPPGQRDSETKDGEVGKERSQHRNARVHFQTFVFGDYPAILGGCWLEAATFDSMASPRKRSSRKPSCENRPPAAANLLPRPLAIQGVQGNLPCKLEEGSISQSTRRCGMLMDVCGAPLASKQPSRLTRKSQWLSVSCATDWRRRFFSRANRVY